MKDDKSDTYTQQNIDIQGEGGLFTKKQTPIGAVGYVLGNESQVRYRQGIPANSGTNSNSFGCTMLRGKVD